MSGPSSMAANRAGVLSSGPNWLVDSLDIEREGWLTRRMTTTTCTGCGTEVDALDLFPRNRCLSCHAKAFDLLNSVRPQTAEDVARMWR